MDFLLDILIPINELNKVGLKEQFAEWGGKKFFQEPQIYIGNNILIFEKNTNLEYYSKLIGNNLDSKKYCALFLKGKELLELEFLINTQTENLNNNKLLAFMEKFITLSSFYIFLLREDEDIKQRYEIKNKEEINTILCNSLSWATPKDVLIFKK